MPPKGWVNPDDYWRSCEECGSPFRVRACEARKAEKRGGQPPRYCSHACKGRAYLGAGNPKWRGGTTVMPDAYVYELAPDHPHATQHGYVAQHRLVVERAIGRYLDPVEEVHHRDHVRDHNDLDNLELLPNTSAHRVLHGYWQDQPCGRCGAPCRRSAGHRRRHARAFCSLRCTALFNLDEINARRGRVRARVIGLDPGLANMGIAELVWDGHSCTSLTTRHEKTHPPATPTDDQTAARMSRMIRAAAPVGEPWLCEGCGYTHNPPPSDLVMVMLEGPSYGSDTRFTHESAGLWWRLRSLLTSRGIAVGKCPPATLKLYAANHGAATKAQMKMALDRMWPGVLAKTEHEVDAALLALAAAQQLGWFTGLAPLRQAPALGKMTWPQLPDQRPVPAATS